MADAEAQVAGPLDLPSQEERRLELQRARQTPALDRATQRWGAAGIQSGGEQPAAGPVAVDRAVARESQERRMETRMMTSRASASKSSGGGGDGKSGLQAAGGIAAAGSGALGGAAMSVLGGAASGGSAASGIKPLKQQLGASIIKSMWLNLLDTFGHSIWVIDLMFILGWSSKFLREYIPEVGMEWIPQNLRDKLPRAAILPLKLAEVVAMGVISLIIGFADVAILTILVLLISVLMAVGAGAAKAF